MADAPDTLPADFFSKSQASTAPDTLPADFFSKPQSAAKPAESHGSLYNATKTALDFDPTTPYKTGNAIIDAASSFGQSPMSIAQGAVKGLLSTGAGLGTLFNKAAGSNQPFSQKNLSGLTESNGFAQGAGKLLEQAGEFATGEGAASKLISNPLMAKLAAGLGVGATQSGGDPVATAVSTALPAVMAKPVVSAAAKSLSKFMGLNSGAGTRAMEVAFENPKSSGLAKVMRGEWDVDDVIKNLQGEVTDFRDAASAKYAGKLANLDLKANKIPDWDVKAGKIVSDLKDGLEKRLSSFGITRNGDGSLNFRHASPDIDKGQLQGLVDTVQGWGSEARDLTASGVDTLKKNIADYAGSGGKLGALAAPLKETAKDGLENAIPGYAEMTKDYAESADLLRKMKSEMSVSASGNTNPGTVARKLAYLLKQSTDHRENLLEKLPNGHDLIGQIAGLHLNSWAPKGLLKVLGPAELASGLAFHAITPAALPLAAATSPRIGGEFSRMAGRAVASKAAKSASGPTRNALQAAFDKTGQD